jgi:hypothetical protein
MVNPSVPTASLSAARFSRLLDQAATPGGVAMSTGTAFMAFAQVLFCPLPPHGLAMRAWQFNGMETRMPRVPAVLVVGQRPNRSRLRIGEHGNVLHSAGGCMLNGRIARSGKEDTRLRCQLRLPVHLRPCRDLQRPS